MHGLIDIHCHLVPGVDDGSDTMAESMQLLRMEYQEHVSVVIVTPHYRKGLFETPQSKIQAAIKAMRLQAREEGIRVRIYSGCEYHSRSKMVDDLNNKKRPTLVGTPYVLTEFSGSDSYNLIRKQIYDLIVAGYRPIIAHVERYNALTKNAVLIQDLINLGAEIQITSGSLLGDFGRPTRKFCLNLMDEHRVHYIASDAHNTIDRIPNLGTCADFVEKKFGIEYARQLFLENPGKIIAGKKKIRI